MRTPTLLVAHLHFYQHTKPNKKCKRATKPTHHEASKPNTIEKKGGRITSHWQNGGLAAKLKHSAYLAAECVSHSAGK